MKTKIIVIDFGELNHHLDPKDWQSKMQNNKHLDSESRMLALTSEI